MIFYSGRKERLNHALGMLMVMLSGFVQPACGEDDLFVPGNIFTGINRLDESALEEVDRIVTLYQEEYSYISLGIILEGIPVLIRCYGEDRRGIPHHERIWKDGKLDLQFEPGSEMLYSTRGYGVLGDVISMIGGCSARLFGSQLFPELAREVMGVLDRLEE